MVLTTEFIRSVFIKYNIKYFDGLLSEPLFLISGDKSRLGYFQARQGHDPFGIKYKKYIICISAFYEREQKDIEQTIIHEMIHLYISQNNIKDNGPHGERFKREANRINKDGWDIARTSSVSNCSVSEKYKRKTLANAFICEISPREYFSFLVSDNTLETQANGLKNYFKRFNNVIIGKVIRTDYVHLPLCSRNVRGKYLNLDEVNQMKQNMKDIKKYTV